VPARFRIAPLVIAALFPALAGAAAPPSIRARAIRWTDEKRNVEVDITYPALAMGARGAAEFDAFFERQARRWEARARKIAADPKVMQMAKGGGAPSAVGASYTIALATSRLVTVVSSGSEYMAGGAHALPFRTATTFDLERGRPLRDDDLFTADGKRGAVDLVLRKVRRSGGVDEALLGRGGRRAAADLSNWTFRAESVDVVFPVTTVAPYANGEIPVRLGYNELRPFLRTNGPLPPR